MHGPPANGAVTGAVNYGLVSSKHNEQMEGDLCCGGGKGWCRIRGNHMAPTACQQDQQANAGSWGALTLFLVLAGAMVVKQCPATI